MTDYRKGAADAVAAISRVMRVPEPATHVISRVTVAVVWHGVDTFTGPGVPAGITADIGRATVAATRTYRVDEVRAVIGQRVSHRHQ